MAAARQLLSLGNICFKDVRLRLALHGCTNRPFLHVVAIDRKSKREGDFYEQLGSYDPMANKDNEKLVALNFDRIKWWLAKGAEPSKPVAELLGLCGFLPLHPMSVIKAQRNRQNALSKDSEPTNAEEGSEEAS
ncbi:small ribosomal subunit protein bS16m-like [Tubulanus polymorphus]|uniref:small ribosomal subunit protein bS16m-like n=1 Tax=Tubulanus polymorphus TaxID=672921 RepID=UPI003DA68ED6